MSRIVEIKAYTDGFTNARRLAWLRSSAQARFRNEAWSLTFDEFCHFWSSENLWARRGRSTQDLVLTRIDVSQGWTTANCVIITRGINLHMRSHKNSKTPEQEASLFAGGIFYV